ncbi:MAG: hypothetical protein HKN10_01770 [Myxococcales bacterium]|nr:hypothetical protein [Myxococcales bacterium]
MRAAVDYSVIRERNLKDYGTRRTFWQNLLAGVYSFRTHFILELLQNAEDARRSNGVGASRIRFDLRRDRLRVLHDGRPFTPTDVRAICSVGDSSKERDPNTIGRFGIGFKSVFSYTDSPTVHCPPEHFRIHEYVDPIAVEPEQPSDPWTTVFEFEFNRPDIGAEQAYAEIRRALSSLTPRTLLFLKHLNRIEWSDQDGGGGWLERSEGKLGQEHVVCVDSNTSLKEEWLVFGTEIAPTPDETSELELAFLLDRDSEGQPAIVPASDSTLVTYFPTKKETRLGFLIQAPFDLAPNRESLHEDSPVNTRIIRDAADFLVKVLYRIRDAGLLTPNTLQALPLEHEAFRPGSFFHPMFESVREALRREALLPRADGGFAPASELRIPGNRSLRDLLTPSQLGELLGKGTEVHWMSPEISKNRTPRLHRYLFGFEPPYRYVREESIPPLIQDLEVGIERVLDGLAPEFLARQSDAWIARLYRVLGEQRALAQTLHERRLIRTESNEHVAALGPSGDPQIWLPPAGPTEFQTVRRAVAAAQESRVFLDLLGLTEPDLVDDVLTSTLPRYRGDLTISPNEHRANLGQILQALRTASKEKKRHLLSRVQQAELVQARNAATGNIAWCQGLVTYRSTDPGLLRFAKGNPAFWLLAEDDPDGELDELWDLLGVRSRLQVQCRVADRRGHVQIVSERGHHERGLHGFDPDFSIDGLAHALAEPTLEKAEFIWRHLLQYESSIRGEVEKSTRQNWEGSSVSSRLSKAGELLVRSEWLPDRNGSFHCPGELTLDELPDGFHRNETLASALRMVALAARDEVARTLGLGAEDLPILIANLEMLPDFVAKLRESGARSIVPAESDETPPATHIANRQRTGGADVPLDAPLPVAGPRTKMHARDAIDDSRAKPKPFRVEERNGVRKVLGKDAAEQQQRAKEELLADYAGRCQVCRRTFITKGGSKDCELFQWQPAVSKAGELVAGNFLLVCGWHSALLHRAKFTLFGDEGVDTDGLVTRIADSTVEEDLDGPAFSMPISFHQVADGDRLTTTTVREAIRFSEPHWISLRLLLGIGEEHE